ASKGDPSLRYGSIDRTAIDTSPGAIRTTDRALDVALPSGAFLALSTARGERFTRAGSLSIADDGSLKTQAGVAVAGESGDPIRAVPQGGDVHIGQDGTVTQAGAAI